MNRTRLIIRKIIATSVFAFRNSTELEKKQLYTEKTVLPRIKRKILVFALLIPEEVSRYILGNKMTEIHQFKRSTQSVFVVFSDYSDVCFDKRSCQLA